MQIGSSVSMRTYTERVRMSPKEMILEGTGSEYVIAVHYLLGLRRAP